jgi:(E)-4-hydroxy-3-methylbut-2-enyl-diphosphate synthase
VTNVVKIGNICIGGGNKIAVQSMTNVSVLDVEATTLQLRQLQLAGCDIVRVAVPDIASALMLSKIKRATSVPIVADTHFDHRIAIAAMENGADKVRINPGNMSCDNIADIVAAANMHGVPLRIGVNGGSVNKSYLAAANGNRAEAIVNNLADFVLAFEKLGFSNLVLSVKSSSVTETIKINRQIAAKFPYPLHIGVTEAGLFQQGLIKNSIAIGSLLVGGIGDTIRVSLTADPVKEVATAKDILNAIGKGSGVQFVSCPQCGRCKIDLVSLAEKIFDVCKNVNKNIKIAVMGCIVNGPGECMDAELGIAGGDGKVALFKKGKVIRTVDERDAVKEFTKELELL